MKTNCLLTVAGAALLVTLFAAPLRAENARFRERVAAWQSPAGSRSASGNNVRPAAFDEPAPTPATTSDTKSKFVEESVEQWTDDAQFGDEYDSACCVDGCGRCMDWSWCGDNCGPRLWWVRQEGMLFWGKGRDLPPLVTTSTVPVPPPGTTLLYGGGTENSNARVGSRIDFGTWLSCDECVGLGIRFWGLAKENSTFSQSSSDLPNQTIERPFIQSPNTSNSLVIADPFTGFNGNINITSTSDVFGADAYARIRCYQSCRARTDFVTGYQFSRINESLRIHSETQTRTLLVNDDYTTYNEFHGGVIGVLHDTSFGCVNLMLLARVGLGNMHQTATAVGDTNGQQGGLLVESNTTVVRDKFCAAPELGATVGYQFSPCMSVTAGYSILAWSNIARPEAVTDNFRGNNVTINFRDSSFWVQGVTAGLTLTY